MLRKDSAAPPFNQSHYYASGDDGREFSVVDMGHMMKGMILYTGGFKGWEAISIDNKGELDHDSLMRAESLEDLIHSLGYESFSKPETMA